MILSLRGVRRSYGGVRAVDGVDLDVAEGELVGLIGPNGAGKTTLVNIVSGLERAQGRVLFRGEDAGRLPPHRLAARGVARTFQTVHLLAGETAAGNVILGMHPHTRDDTLEQVLLPFRAPARRRGRMEAARELLERVGLAGSENRLAATLSYGDQRRLEIARALALRPALLLLDEPAAGMGEEEIEALARLLRELSSGGLTILLVEHHLRLVLDVSHRVAVMDFGRLIADGPPAEVVESPAVVEAYLGREGRRLAQAG